MGTLKSVRVDAIHSRLSVCLSVCVKSSKIFRIDVDGFEQLAVTLSRSWTVTRMRSARIWSLRKEESFSSDTFIH